MHNYSYNSCNFPGWFQDLKLKHGQEFLWLMHHEKRTELKELLCMPEYQHAKNIFLVDTENIHCNNNATWINDNRIHFFMPCVSDIDRCYTFHFWFNFLVEIESHLNYRNRLIESYSKEYLFEALLGTHRPHKDIVKKYIDNSTNRDLFFVSYTGNPENSKDCKWINGSDSESEKSGRIVYNDGLQTASSSLIIPYNIYNQCYYSLVAETSEEQPNFYTEKTGKPLLSKRLFVMFAGQYHLKHLRDFGFKTFDGIIDESYDDIADTETRYREAWKQVEFLMSQHPAKIYKRAESRLEHNQKHFMQINWQEKMFKKIQNISQSSK